MSLLNSDAYKGQAKRLMDSHDRILQSTLEIGSYNKLYSFKYTVNGFAVHLTPTQVLNLFKIHFLIKTPINACMLACFIVYYCTTMCVYVYIIIIFS